MSTRRTRPAASAEQPSPRSPFSHATFAVVWTATVVSNVGGWMYGAASRMADDEPRRGPASCIALVQVATTLPMFLFAVPAGALADIIDRRKFLS
jgi:MFS family permease